MNVQYKIILQFEKSGDRYNYNEKIDVYSFGLVVMEMIIPRKNQNSMISLLEVARKNNFPHCILDNDQLVSLEKVFIKV